MKLSQRFKFWWRGKYIPPTFDEIFDNVDCSKFPDKYKQPLIAKTLVATGRFWVRRWPVLLPVIVGAIVALFIHFDSKAARQAQHEQNKAITNSIHN